MKEYIDYHEALKIKNHLSYKLGNAIVLSFKYWYKGRLLKLPFELVSIYKNTKGQKGSFMQTKIVGVVIPIYNVEEYLRECLDSVINQTYINLEIILVNDGSTDENSLNIAKEYTLKDKRITLFDKENGV